MTRRIINRQTGVQISETDLAKEMLKKGVRIVRNDTEYYIIDEQCNRVYIDTKKYKIVEGIICVYCLHEWTAPPPNDGNGKYLECPKCHKDGGRTN